MNDYELSRKLDEIPILLIAGCFVNRRRCKLLEMIMCVNYDPIGAKVECCIGYCVRNLFILITQLSLKKLLIGGLKVMKYFCSVTMKSD